MRIVAVADTHLFHDDGYVVPDGDVLVHAGDLCRCGDLDELAIAARWLTALPHRHKIVVAGNHDWVFARAALAAKILLGDAIYLEDGGVDLDGVRFWGSPWQPAFNDWAFNLPRGAKLRAKWAHIPTAVDVLITHGPPAGFGDASGMDERAGCDDLRARVAVVRPRLHLFGHIHRDGGFWRDGATAFANVTTWECTRAPTVVDIDGATVTPVSIPPHGRRDDEA